MASCRLDERDRRHHQGVRQQPPHHRRHERCVRFLPFLPFPLFPPSTACPPSLSSLSMPSHRAHQVSGHPGIWNYTTNATPPGLTVPGVDIMSDHGYPRNTGILEREVEIADGWGKVLYIGGASSFSFFPSSLFEGRKADEEESWREQSTTGPRPTALFRSPTISPRSRSPGSASASPSPSLSSSTRD